MTALRTRTRTNYDNKDVAYTYFYKDRTKSSSKVIPVVLKQIPTLVEITEDEIHPKYPHEGGPFESRKLETTILTGAGKQGYDYLATLVIPSYQASAYHEGSFYLPPYITNYSCPPSNMSRMNYLGTEAWNKFKPAKPDLQLAVFIAELRDIPGLMFKRLNSFRSLGQNYLALEFGWKPFLRDLKAWFESIIQIDTKIAQLKRDNGQWIKRGGTLFDTSSPTSVERSSSAYAITGVPRRSVTTTTSITAQEKCWFTARFKYYIPGLDDNFGHARAVLHTWGLEITPEQLWQLIPFSWLVDWFSNIGSLISNLMSAAQDNLTAKYAYVMLTTKTEYLKECVANFDVKVTQSGTLAKNSSAASTRQWLTVKTRSGANPFGFGVDFSSLTGKQMAILSALGLSKLKF